MKFGYGIVNNVPLEASIKLQKEEMDKLVLADLKIGRLSEKLTVLKATATTK